MNEVVVTLSSSMERTLLYVALSRATSLNGLYLIGKFKKTEKPSPTHQTIVEMTRLRTHSKLVPRFMTLRIIPDDVLQIVSHNVQSLRKHWKSLTNDLVYTNSHLLLFQETWSLERESYDIPGFEEVVRNNLNGRPSAFGTVIYVKTDLRHHVVPGKSISIKEGEQHIEITTCKWDNIQIINIYKSPKASVNYLIALLKEHAEIFNFENVLIAGDFNERLENECKPLENNLKTRYNLTLLSPRQPTTNAQTTIDAVFGKIKNYETAIHVYESVFSYHKPLILRFKPEK